MGFGACRRPKRVRSGQYSGYVPPYDVSTEGILGQFSGRSETRSGTFWTRSGAFWDVLGRSGLVLGRSGSADVTADVTERQLMSWDVR